MKSENRFAIIARERARKLREGRDLSPKETARVLCDAAQQIEVLEHRCTRVTELEAALAAAVAWREGFTAGRGP